MKKFCKKHKLTDFIMEGRGYSRCKKCRSEAVQRRREKIKLLALEYKGSKCLKCSYNTCSAALEFHHIDPSKKDFGLSHRGLTRSWAKVKAELDKCVLLCANCHRELHANVFKIEDLL